MRLDSPVMDQYFLENRLQITVGDITKQKTDAIVNAANWTLMGGGGVDGAIHRVGGPDILKACKEIRATTHPEGLPTGDAVITTAGHLESEYVIHTVGPIYGKEGGKEDELLKSSYFNSLSLAIENGVKTISFPSISTGAFCFPKHKAAQISSDVIRKFLLQSPRLEKVILVFISVGDSNKFLKHRAF